MPSPVRARTGSPTRLRELTDDDKLVYVNNVISKRDPKKIGRVSFAQCQHPVRNGLFHATVSSAYLFESPSNRCVSDDAVCGGEEIADLIGFEQNARSKEL
jgi:hypothetical protein